MLARAAGILGMALTCIAAHLVQAQPVEAPLDAEGRPELPGTPALRVVTLAPSLTELVFAAGAGDKLAGVSAYSDFPAEARSLPQVASATGISWESLLALQPDLVLAWKGGTRPADISRLNALGVNVHVVEIRRLADVPQVLRTIGNLVGRPGPAARAAEVFRRQVVQLQNGNKDKAVVRSFFEISASPLMTINGDHVISELIGLCGGVNVFGDASGLVSEPSREELLARKPDAILYGKLSGDARPTQSSAYAGLRAAQLGRIYGITADYAFRPGPRLLLAADEICGALDRSRVSMNGKSRP